MGMFKGYLFIFLITHIRNPSDAFKDVYDTGKEVWRLYLMIEKINFNTTHNVNDLFSNNSVTYGEIRNQLEKIHERFDQMDTLTHSTTICDSFKSFNIFIYKAIVTLEIFILRINDYYKQFYKFMNEADSYPHPFPNSKRKILNVEEKLGLIRKIIVSSGGILPNDQNVISSITSFATAQQTQLCDIPQTISRALVQLFRMAVIAEMKANIILAYVRIQQIDDTVGWMNSYAKKQFQMYFEIYVNLFAFEVQIVEGVYLRACEPDRGIWIRNKNFYEIEGTIQCTIFGYNWMKCKFDSCNDVWFKKRNECDARYYDNRSGCSGTPSQCVYLRAIQACVLETGPYKFHYVKSTEKGPLGRNFECPGNNSYIIEHGTGWDFTAGTCACNCYRDHNKISLLIMESRESANMVITGLRFIREDGILYIQPREGKLGTYGHIFPHSERWIPIPKNTRASQIHSINREHRVFFLDDLHLDSGFVLTGVKFNKVTRGTVTGFAIQIFGVPFNYESGQLQLATIFARSKQVSNENSGQPLSFEAMSLFRTRFPLTVSPSIKKYVSLERSELLDNFGQSTLPFFDAVPITTRPPSPLRGLGIFHKGTEGYAGFISLRVYGINYAQYFMAFHSDHEEKGLFNHL